MVLQHNLRSSHSSGEENATAVSHHQGQARPQQVRSRRRRSRQKTPELQGREEARALQVYRFRSRAPSTSAHCSGEGSLGVSRIPAPTENGKFVEMLTRSASSRVQQEPARCWVRDCTGLACSGTGRLSRTQYHLLGDEGSLTSLIREESVLIDEGNDGKIGESGTASFQADVTSDDAPRSLAEEYSLAPLNTRKKYSAWSFDQEVQNYFKWL